MQDPQPIKSRASLRPQQPHHHLGGRSADRARSDGEDDEDDEDDENVPVNVLYLLFTLRAAVRLSQQRKQRLSALIKVFILSPFIQ